MYDTLVLPGISIHMTTLLGALDVLYDRKKVQSVNTYIGTSSGAICGYLLALGYTPIDIFVHLCVSPMLHELGNVNLINMISGKGAVDFFIIRKKLEEMTLTKVNEFLTLKQLYDKLGKTLVCCTYNLTKKKIEYVSRLNYPDLPCTVALQMSANIPLVFSDFKYFNNYYIDGGILDKFPIHESLKYDGKHILGVTTPPAHREYKCTPSTDILNYVHDLVSIPLDHKLHTMLTNNDIPERCTVHVIKTLDVSFLQFDQTRVELYKLFTHGYEQMNIKFST